MKAMINVSLLIDFVAQMVCGRLMFSDVVLCVLSGTEEESLLLFSVVFLCFVLHCLPMFFLSNPLCASDSVIF